MKFLLFAAFFLLMGLSVGKAQFSMNGAATKLSDSTYRLTSKTAGEVGTIWDSTLRRIDIRFDVSFNLRFGCDNAGGKGIAFVLQNDFGGLGEIALDPQSMGYQNEIGNSIAIEFDTQNDGGKDATFDHVAIHVNGDQGNQRVAPVGFFADKRDVEDCGLYRVRVSYSPSITTLSVYVDCNLIIQHKIDLINDIFNGKKEVFMGFTASNGTSPTPHLVEYLGTTKSNQLELDLANICPDTLVLGNKSIRQEFSDFKWTIVQNGKRLDSIYKYKANWGAPSIGDYKIELEALRTCDSLKVVEIENIEAIDSVEVLLSFDVDTNCADYKFRVNTSCYNCDELQWDFKDQKAAWGFPFQILNLTKNQDFRGYFRADARQGHCIDSDSQYFKLFILNASAPKLWLSTDTLCGGETLEVRDSVSGMDSVVFKFSKGFGLSPQRATTMKLKPTGFGRMRIFRSIYYPQGCVYGDTTTIQIDTMPQAVISVVDSTKNCDLVSYSFENKSQFASKLEWQGPKGKTSDNELEFDVDTNLAIKVMLIASNGGCKDTTEWSARPVVPYTPDVRLTVDMKEGCSPLKVALGWESDPLDSFYVDFDNGNDSSGTQASNNWVQIFSTGRYDIEYTTYSGNGDCENTVRLDEFIRVYDSVVASLYFEKKGGCSPFRLEVDDSSYLSGSVLKEYFFSISQKDTINFRQVYWTNDVNRTLEEEGIYYVYYSVSNGFCADTAAYTIEVRTLAKNEIPDMYGVTVNEKQQVELSWHPVTVASKYNIKRFDDLGDEVNIFAHRDTILIDSHANTARLQYTYKVSAADDCGNTSAPSIESKTILLSANISTIQEADLTWTEYAEFPFGVAQYEFDDMGQRVFPVSGTTYHDDKFFTRQRPDTGRCYRIVAYENGGDQYVSYSNMVCLNPAPQVYFPNAFTPNSEGLNDTFLWRGVGISQVNVSIFNRWGEKVYEGDGQWDGTFNAVDCREGLYYFVANFVATNGRPFTRTGQFHLIR